MPNILFVVAHDSQFKWCARVAAVFDQHGWSVTFFCPTEHAQVSDQQIAEAGIRPELVVKGDGRQSVDLWRESEVVVFPTPGDITQSYLSMLYDMAKDKPDVARPLTVSGYVGLVISNHENGYLARACSDLICVNSNADLELFMQVAAELGSNADNLALTGLPILPAQIAPQRSGPIRTTVFADQMAIPRRLEDRAYLYDRLLEYALRHPDRILMIKPRHRLSEGSYKKGSLHPERFYEMRTLPDNLRIVYTPVSDLLATTDLLLTISSTAAIEAVVCGCRTAVIGDFGFDSALGNAAFVGSGLVRSLDQIIADDIPQVRASWVSRHIYSGKDAAENIYEAVCSRLSLLQLRQLPLSDFPLQRARRTIADTDLRGKYGHMGVERKERKSVPKKGFWARLME